MDLTIATLILALIGFALAIYAIITSTRSALHPPKKKPISDGLYRLKKIGSDGLDELFEIEEVSNETSQNTQKSGSHKG